MITVENFKVKSLDVEASIEIVVEDVARRVNVRAGMSGHFHVRVIGDRSVLHTLLQPYDLADSLVGPKGGHVGGVWVSDVEDTSVGVDLSFHGDELDVAGARAVGRGISLGGEGRGEEESGHSDHPGAEQWEQQRGSHGGED